jgi:hypothetical protein
MEFCEDKGGKSAKVVARLENGIEDTLAVMAPPAKYRRRMKSTTCRSGSSRKSGAASG